MAPTPPNVFFIVHFNGKVSRTEFGTSFEGETRKGFNLSIKSTFADLKQRIEEKFKLGDLQVISQILYRHPVSFAGGNVQYNDIEIADNDDVASMFAAHRSFEVIAAIELCVTVEENHERDLRQTPQPHHTQQSLSLTLYENQPSSSQLQPQTDNQLVELFHFQYQDVPNNNQPEGVSDESDEDESLHLEEDEEDDEDVWGNILSSAQQILTQDAVPIRAAFCPPLHMRQVDMAAFDARPTEVRDRVTLPVDGGIEIGMTFHNKQDCLYAIKHYHIRQSLDFGVIQSDPERYVIHCTNSACRFKLRASYRKRTGKWKISTMTGPHNCTSSAMSQDHRKLNCNMISESIKSLVHKDASIEPKMIIAHIREKFNYTITYRKAWMAKNKAVESIYGNWEKSYNDLPQWLMVMKSTQPGTVVDLQTLPKEDGGTMFHRLFWAFQPCIHGFKFCKPVIHVDGTWLYGKYRGTLLLAVAQDGNNKTLPIAFALVEGETKEGWGFFMKNLRNHVTLGRDICVISDQHESIKSAFNNPQNGWYGSGSTHVYCIRHITQTFMRAIKDQDLKETITNMGYAMNIPLFEYYRGEIREANQEALNWVDNIPKEKWTQAHDEGMRWGHMTTNLVESWNFVFKGTRNLPITALVQSTYYRLGCLFAERAHMAFARVGTGDPFTQHCMDAIKEDVGKSKTHQVNQIDREQFTFSVRETINYQEGRPMGIFKVNLQARWCECGKFQALHMPCSHVIAVCSIFHYDYQTLIPKVFTNESVYTIYNNRFKVVQDMSSWPPHEGPKLYHNPAMRRLKKGRPNSTRISTEMDIVEKTPRKCGLCQKTGHIRRNCPFVNHP